MKGLRTNAMSKAIAAIPVIPDQIALVGGLDLVTPPLQLKPGFARRAQNFEASQYGGYRRIPGYERFSGKAKPSEAAYTIINVTISGSFAVGNTVTGQTSGATGTVVAVVTSGDPDYLVLAKVTGVYQNGENLQVSAVTQGVASSAPSQNAASSIQLHAQYKNLAADSVRNDIAAVPGSGPIRGVWVYNDIVYAFRNNVGATACDMYKSSASGWQQVTFEKEVAFTVGSGSVDDGDTLTQGGVTATVRRVVIRSGTLGAGSAAGILVISAPSGGNFAAGAATTTGGGTLTLSGAETNIVLDPNGRFEFVNTNFGGATQTKRMYGCDGVNRAFEFDGTYFVPIPTGMTLDQPQHIAEHKKHLFLSFNSSVQHSGTGTPFMWTPISGAAELGMGDNVSAFASQPGFEGGGALAIFTRNRLSILYGSSSSDWTLVPYRDELGAYAYTVQDIGYSMFLDDRGITDLQTAQSFGNFAHATISDRIRALVTEYRSLSTASMVSRDRSQYRLFFSNQAAFYVTILGRKVVGIMPMLFPDVARCAVSAELNDGTEAMYFGSDDGWVFQLDRGTSFDGDAIEAFIELAFNFQGSPHVLKSYREALVEITGLGYAEFGFGYTLGYGSTEFEQPAPTAINFSSARWDAFTWDNFTWDGTTLVPNALRVDGTANNISLAFTSSSDYFEPFVITGTVVTYSPRRRLH